VITAIEGEPPNISRYAPRTNWQAVLDEVRAAAGNGDTRWQNVATAKSENAARGAARMVRYGAVSGSGPAGTFETSWDHNGHVFARLRPL
jgi:hypothetical protein